MASSFPVRSRWLATDDGQRELQRCADGAAKAFLDADLVSKLRNAVATAAAGRGARRITTLHQRLADALATLAVACEHGAKIDSAVWEIARHDYLPSLLSIEDVSVFNAGHDPQWRSDLWTADTGVSLAIASAFWHPALGNPSQLRDFIRAKCLAPILADWLDDATRKHSLDSMGHNWWSVIVGGAGIMAAILKDVAIVDRVSANLRTWFAYPGNRMARKQRNFGAEGDFVEGFGYAEYALINVCVFSFLNPSFRIIPEGLSADQAAGLAKWFKGSFARTNAGFRPYVLGDVTRGHEPHGEVWLTLAKLTGDLELQALFHEIRPQPRSATELLMWVPPTPIPAVRQADHAMDIFPTSGIAQLRRGEQCVTVRAGEFWNHNHLDAGTFILTQDEAVWVDDSGTCDYSRKDYGQYYVMPPQHNVAYAPGLVPPTRRTHYEGLSDNGEFLATAISDHLTALCVDTGVLCAGALLRSYRWFFQLDGGVLVIWDDLGAHREESFTLRVHTQSHVTSEPDGRILLTQDNRTCSVHVYSELPAAMSIAEAPMGQIGKDGATFEDARGSVLEWQTDPATRAKFGTAIGTGLRSAEWKALDAQCGWECVLDAGDVTWHFWFNPVADGRRMHQNCIAEYQGLTTDAYALIVRRERGRESIMAIEGSFVRRGTEVLFSNLRRQTLVLVT